MTLDGFGLVSQANLPYFVPFNSSIAPFGPSSANVQPSIGVTVGQLNDAYYQWFQGNLALMPSVIRGSSYNYSWATRWPFGNDPVPGALNFLPRRS